MSKPTQTTKSPAKPDAEPLREPSASAKASAKWRAKNQSYVREYRRAYRAKTKAVADMQSATFADVVAKLDGLAERIASLEAAVAALANTAAANAPRRSAFPGTPVPNSVSRDNQ